MTLTPGAPAAAVAATLAGAAARLAETALLATALAILPAGGGRALSTAALGALFALGVAILLLEQGALRAALAAGRRGETRLRLALAARVPRLADCYVQSRLAADLAERAHLVERVRRGPELGLAAWRAAIDGVLAAAAIGWLDRRLVLPAAGLSLAGAALPLVLLPRCEERSRRCRVHGAALGALLLDVLRGGKAVRAHGAEGALRRRHDELLAGWLAARRSAAAARAALEAAAQSLAAGGTVALVLMYERWHGASAALLLLAVWAGQLGGAGQRLARLVGADLPLHRSLLARFRELLEAEEEAEEKEEGAAEPADGNGAAPASASAGSGGGGAGGASGMAIVLDQLSVEVEGRRLLHDVSVAIAPGEHVALLGASGAGKSTLLGVLLGWHRPAGGAVSVDGVPLRGAVPPAVRQGTAWVSPEVTLWQRSLLANVCCGADGADGATAMAAGAGTIGAGTVPSTSEGYRARGAEEHHGTSGPAPRADDPPGGLAPIEALRAAELMDLVERLPLGLQTAVGEAGGVLSGGERQRLRFARALRRPGVRLALLDEPFRGLGSDQRRSLLATARARWRDATLLCVTHSPAEALDFDRVLVLNHGRLVEDGAPAVLAATALPAASAAPQGGRAVSRFRAMLDAEARLEAALDAPDWRRFRLSRGTLREAREGGR